MTHDTPARYDADGLLTQMRRILDQDDARRRTMDDVNIYVGSMVYTLEQLWDLVGHSDVTTGAYKAKHQARACAALIGDLCRQPNWDSAQDPAAWDTYSDTLRTLRWLLDL